MPQKPTTPFGTIAFGKDGSVQPIFESLGPTSKAQEERVGRQFLLLSGLDKETRLETPDQADHDLRLVSADGRVTIVQCAEVVLQDFLLAPHEKSSEYVLVNGVARPVNVLARNRVLITKIEQKLRKRYAKPASVEFVLLIWTVTGCRFSIAPATEFSSTSGIGPLDAIIFFDMLTRPQRIWPFDPDAARGDPSPQRSDQISIFVPATEMRVVKGKR